MSAQLKVPLKRLSPSKPIPRRENMSKQNTKRKTKSSPASLPTNINQAMNLSKAIVARILAKTVREKATSA
jgi:hypothetical protein